MYRTVIQWHSGYVALLWVLATSYTPDQEIGKNYLKIKQP